MFSQMANVDSTFNELYLLKCECVQFYVHTHTNTLILKHTQPLFGDKKKHPTGWLTFISSHRHIIVAFLSFFSIQLAYASVMHSRKWQTYQPYNTIAATVCMMTTRKKSTRTLPFQTIQREWIDQTQVCYVRRYVFIVWACAHKHYAYTNTHKNELFLCEATELFQLMVLLND